MLEKCCLEIHGTINYKVSFMYFKKEYGIVSTSSCHDIANKGNRKSWRILSGGGGGSRIIGERSCCANGASSFFRGSGQLTGGDSPPPLLKGHPGNPVTLILYTTDKKKTLKCRIDYNLPMEMLRTINSEIC